MCSPERVVSAALWDNLVEVKLLGRVQSIEGPHHKCVLDTGVSGDV